jgi:N-acetylmuramoyl-L-alanine amidase
LLSSIKQCLGVTLIFIMSICFLLPQNTHAFGKQILRVGAQGGDVYELQGRLSFLGYYKGRIDGDFSWTTHRSVRTFQWKFGLRVDGLVGGKTKLKLWQATKSWRPGAGGTARKLPARNIGSVNNFTANEIDLLAHVIHGEARGEPYIGKVAIAAVIINRITNPLFPKSIAGVVYQPGAFTAVADGQINLEPDASSIKAARDAVNGWDPSQNAIYYFNPATATSKWIWSRPQIKQIGKHIFCR